MTTETEKLQKVLARTGLGSRRALEQWIIDGRIRINGRVATLGDRVSAKDSLMVDGEPLFISARQQMIECLIYHKPEGQVCTRSDTQNRPTVFDNLPSIEGGRWISIGRLDLNTSGLLLFTNNGDLANRLMHPSTGVVRRYLVRIRGRLSRDTIHLITKTGVKLDGEMASFDSVQPQESSEKGTNNWVEVSIKEGRYREVRRIFETVGHPVSRLKRIAYGTVKLSRQLRQGRCEKMAPMQLERLLTSYDLDAFVTDMRGTDTDRQTQRKITRPMGRAAVKAKQAQTTRRSSKNSGPWKSHESSDKKVSGKTAKRKQSGRKSR